MVVLVQHSITEPHLTPYTHGIFGAAEGESFGGWLFPKGVGVSVFGEGVCERTSARSAQCASESAVGTAGMIGSWCLSFVRLLYSYKRLPKPQRAPVEKHFARIQKNRQA